MLPRSCWFCSPRASLIIAVALSATACASLADKNAAINDRFYRGDVSGAAGLIDKHKSIEGRDKIIYLMDRGIICHSAGDYAKSNPYLLEAAKLVRNFDIIKWEYEVGKFITNEWLEDYKGEDYERALAHTYLAMNYAALGEMSEARVECKNIDRTLRYIASERGLDYKQNRFSLMLSALIYEELAEYNDAYIDYLKLYKLEPANQFARAGLLDMSYKMGWKEEHAEWLKKFGGSYAPLDPKTHGELIVIFQAGLCPVKIQHPELKIVSKYEKRPYRINHLLGYLGDKMFRTDIADDIEGNMIKTLDERFTSLLAKRAAALGTKLLIAQEIEEEIKKQDKETGEFLGGVLKWLSFASEQPDLRGVYTLPANIQFARISAPAGEHDLKLMFLDENGDAVTTEVRRVSIEAGRKRWVILRTVN